MIIVDTSVWIEFFKGKNKSLVEGLFQLLDDDQVLLTKPIYLEICTGLSQAESSRIKFYFAALPVLYPQQSSWNLVEKWIDLARAKGERFGIVDLLIGAQAKENSAEVWSLDSDFKRMAKLKLISLHS